MKKSFHLAVLAFSLTCIACSNTSGRNVLSEHASTDPEPNPTAPPSGNGVLNWGIQARNNYVLEDGNNVTCLYLRLKASEDHEEHPHQPLNISLVIDRSGSMAGAKMSYARQAAKFVIDQLGPEDQLSIVNYDDRIEVTSPQQYVRNKEALKRSVDRIMDRGSTNLMGGLQEGYRQVQSMKREGYVNRVLLLTDGLANVGITNPEEIRRIVSGKFRDQGIALSTFGLGADYNEDLLTSMAESGGANYYFIAEAANIPDIFHRELKGLLSIVARDAVATINLPAGTICEGVSGYPYEVADGHITIRFNDVFSGEEKGVLIRLKSNQLREGLNLNASLSYAISGNSNKLHDYKALHLPVTRNRQEYNASVNKEVEEKVAMFDANDEFDAIMVEVDKGNYQEAQRRAAGSISKLKEAQSATPSAALKDREEQLSNYADGIGNMEAMPAPAKSLQQKAYKSINYESRKLKR